ncbi:envelope glycoprotein N [Elephantid betaherpesvirus 1]|uniref:Envelope glycoprotein N n=3 Tax=Elephantid herpesvirus 1 TaxID=146015 RepID=M4JZ17_ELHV1|nr:envelope glycoprotein N [Elephant endotheliotropic herpesvirus 1B]ADK70897.1 envelope glycoprotein N [Elephant endotheliotropic herpesvirus 1B]AGE09934.1 envelope glycoprotein N [Elephantid betaherpesvirus 1]AIH00860.1 envelope glycoprotein N [Elephant endotheliotropic herpesvirus 1B]
MLLRSSTLFLTLFALNVAQEFVFGATPAPTVKTDLNIRDFSKSSCSALKYRIYVSSFVSVLNIILYVLLFLASVVYIRYLCHQSITTETVKDY